MANDNKYDLRQVIQQITSIDPVVAIDVGALGDCLERSIKAVAAAGAAAAPATTNGAGKIAVIGAYGPLTPRGSWYGTSLSGFASQVRRAANDGDVAAIVLDIDSPGGTVSGTMEAANEVKAATGQKRVVAVANTLAASAAYWLGSQASEFVMAPSADVGSIGAMIMHQDVSGWLEQMGIKLTMIRSEQSPLKNEAHPFAPLSEDASGYLQARANEAGADFIKAVAAGRGVTQTKVKEDFGQGRVFGAREALARGMVDRVASLDDVIAGLVQRMPARSRRRSALAFE
ncbi:S49 family peptidase [Mesorhizobium sp.]|uniref:S49 family peptidase n=1 Tax=Mesorhizobium sp. TaxID=1871066 RepID=UPI001213268C|nr:S49 family peptidase [Mesorhizobium sp.]TIN82639.1 MAG: S49 family peptidase [Mesorhizobium sp.]